MSILVTCGCGTKLKAPDAAVGKTVTCPKCMARLTLPSPAVEEADETPVEECDEVPIRRRKTTKWRGFPVWAVLLIALLSICGCGILVFFVAVTALGTSSSTSSPDTSAGYGSNQTVERKAAKATREDGYANAADYLDHPEKYKDKRVTLPAEVVAVLFPSDPFHGPYGKGTRLYLEYRGEPGFKFAVENADGVRIPNVQPGNRIVVTFIANGFPPQPEEWVDNRIVKIERLSGP